MAEPEVTQVTADSVGKGLENYMIARKSAKGTDSATNSRMLTLANAFLAAERDAWQAIKNASGSLGALSAEALSKANDNLEVLKNAFGVISKAATVEAVDTAVLQLNQLRNDNKSWLERNAAVLGKAGGTTVASQSLMNAYSAGGFDEFVNASPMQGAAGPGSQSGPGSEPRKTVDRAPVDAARKIYTILKERAAERPDQLKAAVRNLAIVELGALDFAEKVSLKGLEPLGEFSDPQYVALKAGLQKLTDDKRPDSPAALVGEYEILMAAKKKVLGPEGAMSKSAVSLSGPGGEMASEMRVLYTTLTGESPAVAPRQVTAQPGQPGQAGQPTSGANPGVVQPTALKSSNPAQEAANIAAADANLLGANSYVGGKVTEETVSKLRTAVQAEILAAKTMMQDYQHDAEESFKQEAKNSAKRSKASMTKFDMAANPLGAIFGNVSPQIRWQSRLPDYYATVTQKVDSVFNQRLKVIERTPKGAEGHEHEPIAVKLLELYRDIRSVQYGATDPRSFGLVNQILGVVNSR